jgi:hypothetical protein
MSLNPSEAQALQELLDAVNNQVITNHRQSPYDHVSIRLEAALERAESLFRGPPKNGDTPVESSSTTPTTEASVAYAR